MKRRFKELAILLTALGIFGMLVLVSGIVPIKASSGHWPITRWTLDFASNRSVSLHSSGIEVPSMDEPGIVQMGAATFDSNCRWCHGAPGFTQPPVAAQMTPSPPDLSEAVSLWDDAELFYILKHGIKFAGMPAWPTQKRDDEIWPVVAFLRELPKIDASEYSQLVQPNAAQNQKAPTAIAYQVASECTACHGMAGGRPSNDRVPVLASQSRAYLKNSLLAYRSGRRYSGVMTPIAHRLTDQQIDEIASYFSEQPATTLPKNSPPSDVQRSTNSAETGRLPMNDLIETGRQLAHQGDQSAKIPSCVDCHGPGKMKRSEQYPSLAGQPARYLQRQLELFAQTNRGGSANVSLMHSIADKLNKSQRTQLSQYYASLSAEVKK
ncbi:c-type cytochrome [Stieleria sp. TO1_6]|uniref:c-type cytochrome n=1 Tax=Stieleria tagensis TaxID=2956795 RepID=UPI00209AB6EF|nr:c-type cytochrome [Stieleria tagensis]MCO8120886.1 c-type cytochrome [Stieleria tagensis]